MLLADRGYDADSYTDLFSTRIIGVKQGPGRVVKSYFVPPNGCQSFMESYEAMAAITSSD